jgi:hypothetical protein
MGGPVGSVVFSSHRFALYRTIVFGLLCCYVTLNSIRRIHLCGSSFLLEERGIFFA